MHGRKRPHLSLSPIDSSAFLYICPHTSSYSLYRRVHITKATLMELDSKFEVEPGNGHERDEVLAKQNVETFLIVPPKKDGRNGQVRLG